MTSEEEEQINGDDNGNVNIALEWYNIALILGCFVVTKKGTQGRVLEVSEIL